MVLNNTAITTTGGAVASYTALALDVAAVLLVAGAIVSSAGRKKRNAAAATLTGAEERFLQEAVYKVLSDLDDAGCTALALCEASRTPPEKRTPGHMAVIEILSPQTGAPVAWTDINKPKAKYQYAAFIGIWAGLTSAANQCSVAFPTCPLPSNDVIQALTNKELPCGSPLSNNFFDEV
ncbi:uncharacterized protein [Penaeus vannamei]|uniref:uncharacterized protein n=1 Tax=Penaeus vannamei TaxID=6689 RepID=UPI00387F62E8